MLGYQMIASIIITSYNGARYLDKAILSCTKQQFPEDEFEIIVADDNSSEPEVRNVLEYYRAKFPNFKYFVSDVSEEDRYKTARYATQINTAVKEHSKGKYLFYLPHDDYFYPHKLIMHVRQMERLNQAVTYSGQDMFAEDGTPLGTRYDGVIGKDFMGAKQLSNGFNILDHSQVCTRRDAFNAVMGWPDNPEYWSGADAYFWVRLSQAGFVFNPVTCTLGAKVYRQNGVQNTIYGGRILKYVSNETAL